MPNRKSIRGVVGDQQAAAIGQGCFTAGALKSTYGTGCFVIIHRREAVASKHKLLTTIGYRLVANDLRTDSPCPVRSCSGFEMA